MTAPWVKHEWDPENPSCVRCGMAMKLEAGCEWNDDPTFNLCRNCALVALEQNTNTLAEIIPALEIASKCQADELRATCPGNDLTPDEWAALWMSRAILERVEE